MAGRRASAPAVTIRQPQYWADLDPNGFGGTSLRRKLDIPIIARVNGYALSGGPEMVLGCDIIVAADTAKLRLTEPRVGRLPLDGGMVLLQRRIPYAAAMGVMLAADGVTVNMLQPGRIATDRVAALDEAKAGRDGTSREAVRAAHRQRSRSAATDDPRSSAQSPPSCAAPQPAS